MIVSASPDSPEQSMETALIAVKSLIDVDDEVFTDFSYNSTFSNWETREGLIWMFSWSDLKSAYIQAVATADGTLLQFNKYQFDSKSFGFAELSRAEATTIADGFIRKANPGIYSYFGAPASVRTNLHSGDFILTYHAQVNGFAFEAATIGMSVNKFTGEITGYGTRNVNPARFRFESADSIIPQGEAVAAYAEKIGLSLAYRSSFDYLSGKISVFPVYMFNSHSDRFISAITGEVVDYVYDLGDDDMMANASAPESADAASGGGGSSRAGLSPAERAAIEQVAGFLTSEQALLALLEAAGLTDLDIGSFDDQHIRLSRDYIDRDRYFYEINFSRYSDWELEEDDVVYFYGRVDAATGRVTSFSYYYFGMPYSDDAMSEEQATAAVGAFLKKMAPDELSKSNLDTISAPWVNRYGLLSGSYQFHYVRHENDIPFSDNGIDVTFNQHTGKITSYSLNWFENVTFPDVTDVLAPQPALEAFVGQIGSRVAYVTIGESNVALVYDFVKLGFIDPFTGNALDYSGEPWVDNTVTPAYDDVRGHWSESYVLKLLDNDVFLWSGSFEPEKVMTELEFLQYIMLVEGYVSPRLEVQAFFDNRGVNVEASADKALTRQEAARIIAEYLGYGRLAEQSAWFIYPFSDNVGEAYKGHITICYMLGIISGNNGKFDPLMNITRAHAAVLLHNLILARS